jgi:hypothetical protein
MQVDGMDDLEQKAAFKFPEISKGMDELLKEQVITNNLLCRLCTLKEDQQESDNSKHEEKQTAYEEQNLEWKKDSSRKFKSAVTGLLLTGAVLYLDVLKLDDNSVIVAAIVDLISMVKDTL